MPDIKSRTLEKLNHFVGKVCSIMTTPINRNFDERVAREHFVILVSEINADGIWGTHPYNSDLMNFFRMENVVSIHQEEVLDPNNPEHQQMISEYEKKTGKKIKSDLGRSPVDQNNLLPIIENPPPVIPGEGDSVFVTIDNLEKLAEDTKKNYESYDKFNSYRQTLS